MPPPVVVVAIVASIFAAAASPCMAAIDAGPAKPLVDNLPASPVAQDFIRARCDQCSDGRPEDWKMCYELLLPYATSINGSYNRASIAAVTAMVSKLTLFAGKLDTQTSGECIRVVSETTSGAKEAVAKLNRLEAIGDDKVDKENPDLVDVMKWIIGVVDNFANNCRHGDGYARAQDYLSTADAIIVFPRPYCDNSLPSPDGSGP